jgi:hypothetical protein
MVIADSAVVKQTRLASHSLLLKHSSNAPCLSLQHHGTFTREHCPLLLLFLYHPAIIRRPSTPTFLRLYYFCLYFVGVAIWRQWNSMSKTRQRTLPWCLLVLTTLMNLAGEIAKEDGLVRNCVGITAIIVAGAAAEWRRGPLERTWSGSGTVSFEGGRLVFGQ